MIFDNKTLQLQLLDVLLFNNRDITSRTRARPFCALSLRMEGDTEIDLKSGTLHLASRDLTFFPANVAYLRRTKRDHMIVFHFSITNVVTYELEVLHDFEYDRLLPLFTEALDEWRSRRPGYYYRVSAILYSIFALINSSKDPPAERVSPCVASAVAYIGEHYADSTLSVEFLAERAHMSDTYFRGLFKLDMGITPKKYINELRLEHAQSLLNAGYDTIAAVAEKVGFRDAKNFATAFKKRFGYPPSSQTYSP